MNIRLVGIATELWNKLKQQWSKVQLRDIESAAIKRAEVTLVDSSIICILDELRERHVPTIALTSINTGQYGVIENWEDLQVERLSRCNVDFTKTTPFQDRVVANIVSDHGVLIRPVHKSGVIVTDNADKGKILKHFFSEQQYFPRIIIFIDDKLDNVLSLQTVSEELGINFYGFHYVAVKLMTRSDIDEQLKAKEDCRFKALEQHGVWLNDAELGVLFHNEESISLAGGVRDDSK